MGSVFEKFSHLTQIEYLLLTFGIILFVFLWILYFNTKEKRKLKAQMESNVTAFQKTCAISDDAIMILSKNNKVQYANNTMIRLLELKDNFLLKNLDTQATIKVKKEWSDLGTFVLAHHMGLNDTLLSYPTSQLKTSEGNEIPIHFYMDSLLMDLSSDMLSYVITIQDLTKAKEQSNSQFKHQLTQLPNQLQAHQDLPAFFAKAHLEKHKLALVLLHLDNFSRLRSIIGYEQANSVLEKMAGYLKTVGDDLNLTVYHTFDNHFLLTVTNVHSMDDATDLVEDIQQKLASFYKLEDVSLHLTVSAGIALYPDSGSIRKLLDHAYKALVEAEKEGDGKIHIFIPENFSSQYDELRLHNDMHAALKHGEFEVYYQPIIQVSNKEVVAAEALIRWKHPQYGLIPPDVFISLMEKTGFIIKLGQYVLNEVLKQQKRWELFKFKQIEVSINVSMVEINTGEFVQHVEKKLGEHQINPRLLKFEITEGIAMSNENETVRYFHALKKLGVGISLDDFGTGYTSFSYLKKFPADTLKIDKSLVDYILTNEEDQRIVKAIIELSHTLDMKIVVEGIENKKMVEMIASYGCDYMQGYHFAKPLPVFEFQKLLR